jgi:putative addiction module killer protein
VSIGELMYIVKSSIFFTRWFEKQNESVQTKVSDNIDRLKIGNFSNCKLLRNGISELKINFGKGIRIYYTKTAETILILLYGGADKKRQTDDIEKAILIRETLRSKI